MITGGDGERVGSEIHGFKIVDNIEILGIKIDRRLGQIDENWEKALGKMVNKANYWNLFRLSIGGRVMIAKTYLISQLTHLMGTLPVGKNILDRANEVIISFVNGKERKIAANRHFLPRESGGYGITNMNILNMCIKASWIKRWCSSEMRCIKGNKRDPDHINREDINREGFFCCGEIISQWVDFKNRFYEVGRNMLEAKLYDNEMDRNGTNTGRLQILSRQREREMEMNLKEIRVKDMVSRELEPLDLNSINRVIGSRLNFAEYFRLRNEIYKLKNRMESRGQLSRKL